MLTSEDAPTHVLQEVREAEISRHPKELPGPFPGPGCTFLITTVLLDLLCARHPPCRQESVIVMKGLGAQKMIPQSVRPLAECLELTKQNKTKASLTSCPSDSFPSRGWGLGGQLSLKILLAPQLLKEELNHRID